MEDTDAQKKEVDKEEPLEDLTTEDNVTGGGGGGPRVRVFDGTSAHNPSLDAQKKEDA